MKKYCGLLAVAAFLLPVRQSFAQEAAPSDFHVIVSAGYGFPSFTRNIFDLADGENVDSYFIGPAYLKAEFPINDRVGFGVNFAYVVGNATYVEQDGNVDSIFYNTSVDYSSYSIIARVNFHFGAQDSRFDPYAGFGLGYRDATYKFQGGDPDAEPEELGGIIHMGMDFTIGTRFYLTDNIGLYGEVGLAKSIMQAGVVIRL
ncbi:MAG TPA: outer membrane beta-barrel protein [Chitinophagales bacterium]|nr:outer membrane beta-barrel protein [Chitinophagales bacterium]